VRSSKRRANIENGGFSHGEPKHIKVDRLTFLEYKKYVPYSFSRIARKCGLEMAI
jgi:hypothetical protein